MISKLDGEKESGKGWDLDSFGFLFKDGEGFKGFVRIKDVKFERILMGMNSNLINF